ncbi:MAG: TonB-dependent receptor domain-containing protein [Xanthomarina gelatinilytica]|uniref:TonB-dependent receptor domain-containing protein n=1 Tax=Xanthomarina gelatinilytica TaxID=1137281 RepID=UPI003A8531DA
MKNFIAVIAYVFFLQITYAQTENTIVGQITDENKNPLENVNISIKNTTMGVATDTKGNFSLKTDLMKAILVVSNVGFEKQEINVDFTKNTTISVQIQLNKKNYQLEEVVITANQSLIESSVSKAKERQKKIPGGTNAVALKGLKTQRSLTLKDALQLQPGVIIQEFFGANDQPRLNIRGSGIQSNPQRRGINLLQDGITTNFADGSYIIGVLEPRAANYVEVFRGANALKYGAATLGGAVNLVSNNGYNASPFELKLEGGSFGYIGGSVSSGTVFGKNDLYIATSFNDAGGFREHNTSNRFNTTVNFGRKFNDNFESRIYATYTRLRFDVSGPLTQAQLDENPEQINPGVNPPISIGPNVVRDQPRRFSEVIRIANKSIYKFSDHSNIAFALRYQYADDTFVFPVPDGIWNSLNNDYGIDVSYNLQSQKNELSVGASASSGMINRYYYINQRGEKGALFAHNELSSTNLVFFMEDIYKFTPKLSAIASFQLNSNSRNNEDVYDATTRPFFNFMNNMQGMSLATNTSLDQDYLGFNPRIGLIYDLKGTQQLFFNVSRSYEPPTFDELIRLSGGNPNVSAQNIEAVKLDEQTATTVELGTRGTYKRVSWDLSLYHSIVKNEILSTTDLFGTSGSTRNSTDQTIHQGAELGFGATLFKNIFSQNKDELNLRGVYNYSNFYFDEGIYEDKQIAGIPKHYINSSLEYTHPNGIFVALNTEWLPEDTPTDHQNTIYQQAYQLFGFRIGYNRPKWSIFVEGKNMTDEKYASSYLIRDVVTDPPPVLTPDNVTTFIPGAGRNIIVGLNYKF